MTASPANSQPLLSPAEAQDRRIDYLSRTLVEVEAARAIAAASGAVEVLMPHVARHLGLRESDGRIAVCVLDDDARLRLGIDGAPVTVDDLIAALRDDAAFAACFGLPARLTVTRAQSASPRLLRRLRHRARLEGRPLLILA